MTIPFADVLAPIRDGTLYAELGLKMTELVKAVNSTFRAGSLTLTLKVQSGGDGTLIQIVDKLDVRFPTIPQRPTMYFSDDDGNLLRENPKQRKLPFQGVPRPEEPAAPATQKEAEAHAAA